MNTTSILHTEGLLQTIDFRKPLKLYNRDMEPPEIVKKNR